MIDEDELRALLTAEAARYDVPPDGSEALLGALRNEAAGGESEPVPGELRAAGSDPSRLRRPTLVLTGVAAAAVLALLVGIIGHTAGTQSTGSAKRASGTSVARYSARSTAGPGVANQSSKASGGGAAGSAFGRAARDAGPPTTFAAGAPLSKTVPRTASGSAKSDRAAADSPGVEKIVKTGSIELRVPRGKFGDRLVRLTTFANGLGGFVAQTSTSEQGSSPSGTITLRVPSQRFEELLVQVRRLGQVRAATTGSRDVTSEFTDVVGRLRTMRDERDQLSLVLTRAAQNVPDILAVRDRLNVVQAEIEQLEGRRRVLQDQTSLATLTVALSEPGADKPLPRPHPRPHPKQSGLVRAWHEAVDGFTGGVEAIIAGSGKVLLVALCAGAIWLFGFPLLRRVRRSLV